MVKPLLNPAFFKYYTGMVIKQVQGGPVVRCNEQWLYVRPVSREFFK